MTCRLFIVLTRRFGWLAVLSILAASAFTAAPAAAAWSPPTGSFSARTGSALSTGATTASVNGTVNAGGQATTYNAVYDLAKSTWCSSNGASGEPAKSTAPLKLSYVDFYYHTSYVTLTGLTPAVRYCVAIIAYHSSGTAVGSPVRFTAGAPDARTYSVTATSQTTASVYGGVNPAGQGTTYGVRYDVASSAWCSSSGSSGTPANVSAAETVPYTDGRLHDVWATITGLASETNYCAAIVASNASGSASGSVASFSFNVPAVVNYSASAIGTTTATLNGAVDAFGQSTYYGAVYDLASSTWCASSGNTPDATSVYDVGIAFPYADAMSHPVSTTVGPLQASTEYCFTIEASNASGSKTQAPPMYFTTASS